jgi:hypothetical protein
MNAMSVHNIGRVETSPGRRMMKIRAEQKKRHNNGSPSVPILGAFSGLTLQNSSATVHPNVQTSMWALPAR